MFKVETKKFFDSQQLTVPYIDLNQADSIWDEMLNEKHIYLPEYAFKQYVSKYDSMCYGKH